MTHSLSQKLQLMKLAKYISSVGGKKTSDCGGISNRIILICLPFIVQHLTYIYNVCTKHNCFPSNLETAKVIPLPNGKDLSNINNYCPISVLSSISKPLEKHVHRHLLKYLEKLMLPGRGHTSVDPIPLKQHLQYNNFILVHKVVHNKLPTYLRQLLHAGTRSNVNSRSSIFVLPKTRLGLYKMSFSCSGSYCWNMLPSDLKNTCSIDIFKYKILQHFHSGRDMRQSDC